jgi:ATP-binding cassette, subfamily B, bacterial
MNSNRLNVYCIPWDEPPFSFLTESQKDVLLKSVKITRYAKGDPLWSTETPGQQCLVLEGQLRLRQESGKRFTLEINDWVGDCLGLSGLWAASAASDEVIVAYWPIEAWQEFSTEKITSFWLIESKRYQAIDPSIPQPVLGYPYLYSLNPAAACLAMMSEYVQIPVSMEWIQRQLRHSQHAQDLEKVSERLGLVLCQIKASWEELPQLPLPALMYWQADDQSRWVVVYAVQGDRLIISDPVNPRKSCESIYKQNAIAAWDGYLWTVEVTPQQEKFNLKWFLPAVQKYRGLLLQVLVASFFLQLVGLSTPIITQVIVDKVLVHGSLSTLDVLGIALVGAALFNLFLGVLRLYVFTHTARRLDLKLSAQLFRHLMRLPLAYFEARRVGDTVARVQELENIRQFLTGTALTVVLDAIFTFIYLILMFFYSQQLTLVSLAVLPFFAVLVLISTPILRNKLDESFNRRADGQSFLVEAVSGIHAVKAHTAEIAARQRWERLFARYTRISFHASTISNISNNLANFLTEISNLLILWFGAKLVIEQTLTVGELVAFQMLSGRVTGPLLRLVQLWQNFQQVLLSVDRVGDILNAAPESEPKTGLILTDLKESIKFDKVFFRYHDRQDSVLKGISFHVEPGMFVGIVGRSGSGKSTISKLIQHLYLPESGQILFDDLDIKKADLLSLRQQISVVLQDDFLFNDSVHENISLGDTQILPEQVVEAARLACADEFITALPDGYDTNIGERGTALSGGQRQRLALARLFLSNAPILILDEATSALDSETEQQVLRNLQKVRRNRTVFAIAHRFAPLKQADLILVLEKGVLVEQGKHDELLSQRGVYWSLYQGQQSSIEAT